MTSPAKPPGITKTQARDLPAVHEMANAVQQAWDKEFPRPFPEGVDYRQARIAVETVLGLMALDGKDRTPDEIPR